MKHRFQDQSGKSLVYQKHGFQVLTDDAQMHLCFLKKELNNQIPLIVFLVITAEWWIIYPYKCYLNPVQPMGLKLYPSVIYSPYKNQDWDTFSQEHGDDNKDLVSYIRSNFGWGKLISSIQDPDGTQHQIFTSDRDLSVDYIQIQNWTYFMLVDVVEKNTVLGSSNTAITSDIDPENVATKITYFYNLLCSDIIFKATKKNITIYFFKK